MPTIQRYSNPQIQFYGQFSTQRPLASLGVKFFWLPNDFQLRFHHTWRWSSRDFSPKWLLSSSGKILSVNLLKAPCNAFPKRLKFWASQIWKKGVISWSWKTFFDLTHWRSKNQFVVIESRNFVLGFTEIYSLRIFNDYQINLVQKTLTCKSANLLN